MGLGHGPARIFGREAELAAVAAAVRAAATGSGSVVLVEGVAGIGKTRLMTHACEQAHPGRDAGAHRSGRRVRGRIRLGRSAAAVRAHPAGRRGPVADDAAQLAAPALSHDAHDGDKDSFSVLHGLYWLAAALAQEGAAAPSAVDDLHWADEPSQRFVAHLAHRLDGLAILLVLTAREPVRRRRRPGRRWPGWPRAAGSQSCGPRHSARPPAPSSSAISWGAGRRPRSQAACRELTGGNPLLLHAATAWPPTEIRGCDADIPHLRRLTPGTVSRSVLLRLGRMPGDGPGRGAGRRCSRHGGHHRAGLTAAGLDAPGLRAGDRGADGRNGSSKASTS